MAVFLTSCNTSAISLDSIKSISVSNNSREIVSNILSQEEIAERDKEYSFVTQALTESYFKRKLQKLIGSDNGSANGLKIVKELEYARIKGETKIPAQAMFTSDNTFFNTLKNVSAVITERGVNTPFHIFLGGTVLPTNVIAVNSSATGLNNGTSWTNAYTSLQSALTAATSGQEIWVASGTYKPTTDTDRSKTFTLKNGVAIYGGFAGTESARTSRNWNTNVTILSGDINNSNSSNSGDSYHVVTGVTGGTLDGFTIKHGYADGTSPHDLGGGVYNNSNSPTLSNLIISNNSASYGGGMANKISSPSIDNITFSSNSSISRGGGLYIKDSTNVLVSNVRFSGNSSFEGGGLFNDNSSTLIEKVSFINNTAGNGGGFTSLNSSSISFNNVVFSGNSSTIGGAMYNETSNTTITNSTFFNNTSTGLGGIMYNDWVFLNFSIKNSIMWGNSSGIYNDSNSTPTVTYSNIQGGYAGTGNINSDPLFVSTIDLDGADNIWGTSDDGLRLQSGSPSKNTGTN
ncbi:MAG: right-handed parallel beta-helix repeat-containing protein, partial [Candidatus Sericytochromatia bacterium]